MLETVSEIFREAYQRNWITARDGNASVRWARDPYFYITPTAVRKQTLQPEMFLKVRPDSGFSEPISDLGTGLRPSGELPMHMLLQHKIDTDVRVVLHLHPPYSVAAMMAGINLPDLVAEFPELSRYTRVGDNVPFYAPLTEELAEGCVGNLGLQDDNGHVLYHIVGMDKHGVVSVDTSPWRAMEHIERLEHIAKIVLASGKFNRG